MRKLKPVVIFFLLLFLLNISKAQQVNGHWYGIGMIQSSQEYQAYLSELVLQQKGKLVNGYLNYYFRDSLIKVNVKGNFDLTSNRLSITPFPVIYYRSPNARNSIDCMLSGSFTLLASKTSSILTGKLFADDDHKYTVPDINLKLTKSNDTAELVMQNEEPELKSAPVNTNIEKATTVVAAVAVAEAVDQREKTVVREIMVENNRLRIELYDNGEIDYDSVTLYLNKKKILPKTVINHKAIRLNIDLDPDLEYSDLSMFADNLGMIPPNTAALVIYDDKKRYELIMTSDLNKTATIRLRRKK